MSNTLTSEFIFQATPPVETNIYIPLLIVFSLVFALAILSLFVKKGIAHKIAKRNFTPFLTISIFGFIALFARYEALPWLASRFFLILVIAAFFVTVVWNGIWALRFVPKAKKEIKTEDRYQKYLPKAKKK